MAASTAVPAGMQKSCLNKPASPRSATKTPQTFQAEAWSSGGVLGLSKTLRGFSLQDGQKLILVTVGLADPCEQENLDNIRASLRKQLSEKLVDRAKVFHLRGRIDYQKLSLGHRTVMKLLYQSLRRIPMEKQTAENRELLETYGKRVDFTDFRALGPIISEIQGKTI